MAKYQRVENLSDLMDRFNDIATDVLNSRGDNKGINNKKVAIAGYRGMLAGFTAKQRQLALNNQEGSKEMNKFAFGKPTPAKTAIKPPSKAQLEAAANARQHRLNVNKVTTSPEKIAA